MFSERWLSSFAVVAVILITVGYFVSQEPEELQVVSDDGVVTITGLARQTQPLTFVSQDRVMAPLSGSAYTITPNLITLEEPAVIAFKVLDYQQSDIASLDVYRFHPGLTMWEPVTPVVAHTDDVIAVETGQLGSFAVGSVSDVQAPVFANVYDDLRERAPKDAVGYEIAVGFTRPDHEVIRLLSLGERGGCGGIVRVGDGESLSRSEHRARVMVADREEELTFVFVTRWFTSSAGGCAADESIRPLVEYDILDTIHI